MPQSSPQPAPGAGVTQPGAPAGPAKIAHVAVQTTVAPEPAEFATLIAAHAPTWAQREADAEAGGAIRMPISTLDEWRQLGLLAAPIPRELGGWGVPLCDVLDGVRALARVAPSTALAFAMPLGNAATTRIPAALVEPALHAALAEGQRWIAEQVRRGQILAVANSEPGSGGEMANTKTLARLDDDGLYRITGRKSFATIGPDADYFLCAARILGDGPVRIEGFFVARDAVGVTIDERWDALGMRSTASVGISLEQAPAAALFGFPGCLTGLNARHWSTLLFAAVFAGIGEGALLHTQEAAAEHEWSRATFAECALAQEAAAGFIEAVARSEAWPLPEGYARRCQHVKTFVARTSVETATRMSMLAGGRSYGPHTPVARFLRDALAGPLLRPPLPNAMDALIKDWFG